MQYITADIASLVRDARNGWSIGSFGAMGEFSWDPQEPVTYRGGNDRIEIETRRGAMRVAAAPFVPIAWETLSPDGNGWGHVLAFCLPAGGPAGRGITPLGPDLESIRSEDRDSEMFDLGICVGSVRMCVRTRDAALAALLDAAHGADALASAEILAALLRAQPHRVMLSPATRIEVFQPIPPPHGVSPIGPHTHVIPRLIAANRAHSACDPLPSDLQSVLTLHPPAPWRLRSGTLSHDADSDAGFEPLLRRFGLAEELRLSAAVNRYIAAGLPPERAAWPETRRGRTVARIALRRLAASGDAGAHSWRARYDAAPGARTVPGDCRRGSGDQRDA